MSTNSAPEEHIFEEVEVEVSDDELEQELLQEYMNTSSLNDTNILITNDSLKNDMPLLKSEDYSSDLTAFQDSVITTGSGASIILLLILVLIFIIQFVRKAHAFFSTQSRLNMVDNPLDEAIETPAENINPLTAVDPKSYPKYDTPFDDRDIYRDKQASHSSPSVLKSLLMKRAVKCIDKMGPIQRDGTGIRKNWNTDLLPRDVWNDYQSAQRNIQKEIEDIQKENARYQFKWDKYGTEIFAQAREVFGISIQQKKIAIQRRMQQRQQMQRKNSNQAPDPKHFAV